MDIILAETTGPYPYLPLLLDLNRRLYTTAIIEKSPALKSASNLTLAAGLNYLDMGVVFPTQTANLKALMVKYVGTVTNVLIAGCLWDGAAYHYITPHITVVTARVYGWHLDIPVQANEHLFVEVAGATLNNDIYAWATYYG